MEEIACHDINDAIEQKRLGGYRLDMIFPADDPREALMSRGAGSESVKLVRSPDLSRPVEEMPPKGGTPSAWIRGRAGMEYRDLIPGRLGGKVIASHIRLTRGGDIPDYVHFHKVDYQVIYCKRGRIRVVYEDQGPPFWLETGDCILQPPEIRHRVLECTAGAEVVEIGSPALHETWVEHAFGLPSPELRTDRTFNEQRFVRDISARATWADAEQAGFEIRHTGIGAASGGLVEVEVLRVKGSVSVPPTLDMNSPNSLLFYFVLDGKVDLSDGHTNNRELTQGDSFVVEQGSVHAAKCASNTQLLVAALGP